MVSFKANSSGRSRSRNMFGLMLCLLLMVFAVATKTAAYHRHPDRVRGLTHTKVWQNNQDAGSIPTPDMQLDMLFAVVLLLAVPLLKTIEARRDERPAFATSWFIPLLSVRPPPAR